MRLWKRRRSPTSGTSIRAATTSGCGRTTFTSSPRCSSGRSEWSVVSGQWSEAKRNSPRGMIPSPRADFLTTDHSRPLFPFGRRAAVLPWAGLARPLPPLRPHEVVQLLRGGLPATGAGLCDHPVEVVGRFFRQLPRVSVCVEALFALPQPLLVPIPHRRVEG